MATLPDPRIYPSAMGAVEQNGGRPVRDGDPGTSDMALAATLVGWLEAGDDGAIRRALATAPSQRAYRRVWQTLVQLLDRAGGDPDGVAARLFAIPLLLVAGGKEGATIPGTLPDAGELQQVLADARVLGPVRNFGLGGTVLSLEQIEGLDPSAQFAAARSLARGELAGPLDFPPNAVTLPTADESVHLRFLPGVTISAPDAPSFLETAGEVGAWGMVFARALARQLGQPGLTLLALPRRPAGFLAAARIGRIAREEVALQLFVSRELRRMRAETGEPQVIVAALATGEIAVILQSPFDPARRVTHRWCLHPWDDLAEVEAAILGLLAECRLQDVRVLDSMQPGVESRASQEGDQSRA